MTTEGKGKISGPRPNAQTSVQLIYLFLGEGEGEFFDRDVKWVPAFSLAASMRACTAYQQGHVLSEGIAAVPPAEVVVIDQKPRCERVNLHEITLNQERRGRELSLPSVEHGAVRFARMRGNTGRIFATWTKSASSGHPEVDERGLTEEVAQRIVEREYTAKDQRHLKPLERPARLCGGCRRRVSIIDKQPERISMELNTSVALAELPVPKPKNVSDILPDSSDSVVIGKGDVTPCLLVENTTPTPWVSLDLLRSPINVLTPDFPPGVQMECSARWVLKRSFVLVGPKDFSQEITHTYGTSQTDSSTLSAELNVGVAGLSAKLGATLSHSVTITDSTTEQLTSKTTVPSGITRIFAIWQLVETYSFVDAGGVPFTYSGQWFPGGVMFGNWAKLPLTAIENLTSRIYEDETDFPST